MRLINIFIIIFLAFMCISCKKKETVTQSDYNLYISELDMGITTSKRKGGEFYIAFYEGNRTHILSDSIDYIKFTTSSHKDIRIILNTQNKSDIYVIDSNRENVNSVNYSFHFVNSNYFEHFFEEQGGIISKSPYIYLEINSGYYTILKSNNISYEILKEGDIYGGW